MEGSQPLPGSLSEDRLAGLRPSELQPLAATIMQEYRDQIQDHEQKIMELRRRIAYVGSVHNGSAAIVEKLPAEILLHIFRDETLARRYNFMAPIRLTHVCRAWRSLLHRSPMFWVDILDPEEKTMYTELATRFPVVLAAFEHSQPAVSLAFSLHGNFLPTLATLSGHLSRISTLWIECSYEVDLDIRALLGLHIPQLEKLTLLRKECSSGPTIPLDSISTVQFPRLRYLRTDCMKFAFKWVTPAIRHLILGGRAREGEDIYPALVCCRLESLTELFAALERCPDIEELEVDDCLPERIRHTDGFHGLPLPLQALKVLHLAGAPDVVRAVLEQLRIPDTVKITLCNDYHDRTLALCDLLPRKNVLAVVPHIRSVTIWIKDESLETYYNFIACQTDGGEQRLSLYSREQTFSEDEDVYDFNLLAFFKGASSCFSPSYITHLTVNGAAMLISDRGGWLWLFRYHSRVSDLELSVFDLKDAIVALGADVMVHLERLTIEIYTDRVSTEEYELLVSMLAKRASRGVGLCSFSLTHVVNDWEIGLHPTLTDDQMARMKPLVRELSVNTEIY